MAIYAYFEFMMLPILVFIVILHFCSNKNSKLPRNWPIIGMTPTVLRNLHRLPEWITEILKSGGRGGTFLIKGPWFTNTDLLLTSDPANVQHIMSTKFSKYPKGAEWKKRFDLFGDSLFNFDFGEWKYHRALVKGFLNHQMLHLMPNIYAYSMEKQLIPMLEHVSKNHEPVALIHDLLGKHIFYIACAMSFGYDPAAASGSFHTYDSHEKTFSKGIVDACGGILIRHLYSERIWWLKNWLSARREKRLRKASISLHHLISEYISANEKKLRDQDEDIYFNLFKLFSLKDDLVLPKSSTREKVKRDSILTFLFGAHDNTSTTLGWFFWILSKHPIVVKRIREEIQNYFPGNYGELKWIPFAAKELDQMVYLHATLCETLRLYPPVPFEARTALQNDTLPSGHKINEGARIIMCTYAMGRMTSIWGDDCHEFKPERWINDDGGIKHESAHKFFAFNSGPRICLGKDIAFTWLKAITSTIIHNYDVQVVNAHQIKPRPSVILHMNHVLIVTLKKRWA